MAGSSRERYPLLIESLPFHKVLFDTWYAGIDNTDARIGVLEKLRMWRREASEVYFPT